MLYLSCKYCVSVGCFKIERRIPLKQLIYNTALYMRLSRDDEWSGESGSISSTMDQWSNISFKNKKKVRKPVRNGSV